MTFTPAVKENLAYALRRRLEDRGLRIPPDRAIRADLHSLRKGFTATGNSRFDSGREGGSHADRFWALALAVHAASCDAPSGAVAYESVMRRGRAALPMKGCW